MAVGPTSEKTYAHPHCVQVFYPLPGEWGVYRATLIISSSSKSFCKSLIFFKAILTCSQQTWATLLSWRKKRLLQFRVSFSVSPPDLCVVRNRWHQSPLDLSSGPGRTNPEESRGVVLGSVWPLPTLPTISGKEGPLCTYTLPLENATFCKGWI